MTRFARQLVPSNALDRLQLLSTATQRILQKQVQTPTQWRQGIHGVVSRDPQYSIRFLFSTDSGAYFSESPEILDDTIYQVRLEIAQVQADPLLAGFGITWTLPSGWQWTDGLPATTYEEAVSNPLVVTRTARSPVNAIAAGFKAVVIEEFL